VKTGLEVDGRNKSTICVRGGAEHVQDDGYLGIEVAEAGGEVRPRASPTSGRRLA
jgi:hypothetical protein